MLRRHDSKLKLAFMRQGDRLPLPGSWYLETHSPYYQHWQAATAFRALGAGASNAVPMLIQIFRDKASLDSQCACVEALGWIGPAANGALPVLMDGATNADRSMRVHTRSDPHIAGIAHLWGARYVPPR